MMPPTSPDISPSRSNSTVPTDVACPICQGHSLLAFEKYGYWIRDCQSCGHQFTQISPTVAHTQRVYGDDYFKGGGAGYPNYLAESKLLRNHGRRYGKIMQRHCQPGRVLDVGSAAGFILKGLTDCGWQGEGIEPNDAMATHARQQLGLAVKTGALEQAVLEQAALEQPYDLITFVQVLPHFFDLRQALTVAASLTAPGGYWLIETWNRRSLTARISAQSWHEYSPPSVLHWFSPTDVSLLGREFGFRTVAQGRPQKWINAAHAKSLLRYKLQESSIGRWLIPLLNLVPSGLNIPYPAEDLFWILLKKAN